MGYDLVCLDAEPEFLGSLVEPLLDGRFLDQLTKGEIDFDGVELCGVVLEKVFLRQLLRIELRLPARVSPSGRANEKSGHGVSSEMVEGRFRVCANPCFAPTGPIFSS